MVKCYQVVIYVLFQYINGSNHINTIQWCVEMQYNDIQIIIIKQYAEQ